MGRPTKYSVDRAKAITDALRAGNTRTAACGYAGIDYHTFLSWLDRYSTFSNAVKKAEADAEVRNVAVIQKAAAETWQAAAWWLERRRSEAYRQRRDLNVRDLTDSQLIRLLEGDAPEGGDPEGPLPVPEVAPAKGNGVR